MLADEDSVNAKWRPMVGGIQHNIRYGNAYCTIGFVTERNNVDGMTVASHCANCDGNIGGVDDAKIYQPSRHLIYDNKVAVEEIDPYLHSISNWRCPDGYRCRYSDAAFADMESGVSLDLGQVAKPEGVGENDVSPVGTSFEITREASGISTDAADILGTMNPLG